MSRRTSWLERASCRGLPTRMFFPERWANDSVHEVAKSICSRCPVRDECLELALLENKAEDDRWGVFGGMTPHERWLERRRRMKS